MAMRRLSFASLLIAINAGLVLLAVVGVALGAVRVLRQLGDRQALARVDLAAGSAAAVIERAANRALAAARLAADQPALGEMVAAADRAPLLAWLESVRRSNDLTGCALFARGTLVVSAGPPLPWEALRRPAGGRALVGGGGGLIVGGAAAGGAAAGPRVEAVTALALDAAYTRWLGRQVGLRVTVLDSREAARVAAPAAPVRETALAMKPLAPTLSGLATAMRDPGGGAGHGGAGDGGGGDGGGGPAVAFAQPPAARVDAIDLYVADRPLFGPAGEVTGVVEATLPTAAADGSLASLIGRLVLLAVSLAALATAASVVAGRWLGRPVRRLTAAAARLGRGDLTTPIGRAPGLELGALAATLEETRRQLLRLTAELRRRQGEGEAVLTGIAEGVLSVDRDRRIRYLNPQAAALLGVAAEQAVGRFCGDVLDPRGHDGERPCDESCPIVHARFRGSARATEHLQLGSGRQRSVLITSSGPVEERQFLVLRDETDVELARRQRDTVLANISHEFKTPLAAQRASLELLRERLERRVAADGGGTGDSAGEIQDLVLSLERGGLRLTQLIDNLLESVRIESGQDGLRKRLVALDEVIEEAVEMTAPLFVQRRQRLEVELPFPLPPVLGDAPRLTQVFVNLLANAQKFAPAASTVRIGGEVTPGHVVLWLDDQGAGLPPGGDTGREIFRRFVRSPAEMGEPEQSGMGLGLWIVQSIVERHGGAVEAERRNPGTRIRVTLPVAGAGEAGGAAAAADGEERAGRDERGDRNERDGRADRSERMGEGEAQ
jgi:signal transduction histidine kinase/HAMP domain-containing protein